jgi:SAM-dependent methyltransferase
MIYDELGEEYDLLINWDARLLRDLGPIQDLLAGAPGRKLIDVACGTGVLTKALATQQWQCIGVDLSPAMVKVARANDPEGVYSQGSMTTLQQHCPGRHDVICCLGNSLAYLHDWDELLEAANSWHKTLTPGGIAIAQVVALAPEKTKTISGKHFTRKMEPLDGPFYSLAVSRDGAIVAKDRLRAWSAEELTKAFSVAGFSCECFGDLGGNPVEAGSADIVIRAVVL